MKGIKVDPQTINVSECYALVYAPRRQRNRFSENCVTVMLSAENALEKANEDENLRAARVLGPCRSSEAVNIYYLVHWLGDEGYPK